MGKGAIGLSDRHDARGCIGNVTMTDDELDRQMAEEDLLRNGIGRDKWPKVVH